MIDNLAHQLVQECHLQLIFLLVLAAPLDWASKSTFVTAPAVGCILGPSGGCDMDASAADIPPSWASDLKLYALRYEGPKKSSASIRTFERSSRSKAAHCGLSKLKVVVYSDFHSL